MRSPRKTLLNLALSLLTLAAITHARTTRAEDVRVTEGGAGFTLQTDDEIVRVTVCTESVIHVVASPRDTPADSASPAQPWMLDSSTACPGAQFKITREQQSTSLATKSVVATIQNTGGNLKFTAPDGKLLLKELQKIPRTYQKMEVNGERTYRAEDRFSPEITEAVYGLGQHQNGMFNYRGSTIELGQDNTDVAIPLLMSNKGYGLLWNTSSLTYFDNRYPQVFSLSSAAANAIDYYFIYGPEFDQVIRTYRQMTGHVPLFPKWAYGFFQSKDSYESQSEVLEIAGRYRAQHIPLDCMVQDGGWWKEMGDLPFRSTYPDIPTELKQLHDEHVHTMLSVWGGYREGSVNLQHLKDNGWLIPGTEQYDATNPAARDFFWQSLPGPLLAQGWDSFWLDASEPDSGPHEGDALLFDKKVALGSGAMYTNIYPLLHTGGIAEHWKQANQQKRVLLLTRSAFLGEQRNGVAVWSGDVYPTSWGLKHQIAAGLNFAVSGMPYWTTDVAGYFPLYQGANMTTPEYQELYLRWFEFGVFCPMFRTHGHRDHNEIWTYDKVQPALETYDRLRYRMMPYLYSMAWRVTHDDYTILRPLVMDWRTDAHVADLADEYMFGPAFLVSPVWELAARKRSTYLPQASRWFDFWSGKSVAGGQELEVSAPPEQLPLFVRAGSILPLGPEIEYADQKPGDPIELRIYPGTDGDFNLYDDEGDGYNYEHKAYSIIPIHWNESTGTVTFGDRIGSFPGMADHLHVRIVLVREGQGIGEGVSKEADAIVDYDGRRIESTLKSHPLQ